MFNLSLSSLTERAKRKAGDITRFAKDLAYEANPETRERELGPVPIKEATKGDQIKELSKAMEELKEENSVLREQNVTMHSKILSLEKSLNKDEKTKEFIQYMINEQSRVLLDDAVSSMQNSIIEKLESEIQEDPDFQNLSIELFVEKKDSIWNSDSNCKIIIRNWIQRFHSINEQFERESKENDSLVSELKHCKEDFDKLISESLSLVKDNEERKLQFQNEISNFSEVIQRQQEYHQHLQNSISTTERKLEETLELAKWAKETISKFDEKGKGEINRLEEKILSQSGEMGRIMEENAQLTEQIENLKKSEIENSKRLSTEVYDTCLNENLLPTLKMFAKVFDFQNIENEFLRNSENEEGFREKMRIIERILKGSLASYKTQLEKNRKEKEKGEALMSQITRHQADARESLSRETQAKTHYTQLNGKLEESKTLNSNLQATIVSQEKKIKELQRIINDLNENKRNFIEELKSRMGEIEELKRIMAQQNNDLATGRHLKGKMAEFEEKTVELMEIIRKKDSEISEMNEKLAEANSTIESINKSFDSLHNLHEESQLRNESLARKYDTELLKLRSSFESAKSENENLKRELASQENITKELSESRKRLSEKKAQISHLEMEKKELERELSELLQKVKNEGLQRDLYVDKRVITKFLINYFDPETQYQVKVQILETLSSVLEFSEEERKKIGLQKNNLLMMGEEEKLKKEKWLKEEGEKLPDKLFEYLMGDDDED